MDTSSVSKGAMKVDERDGIATHLLYDEVTDKAVVEEVQDVTEILEENKADLADADERVPWRTKGAALNHVARIPSVLYYDLEFQKAIKQQDHKAIRKILNDYHYRNLRVRPGSI